MSNFGMVGKFIVDAEDRNTLVTILKEAAENMSALDECQLYVVSTDVDDDTAVWVMELWTSKAAHDHSLTMDSVKALIGKAMPLIKGMEGASLKPVGGTDIS